MPADWGYVPEGIQSTGSLRLLFVTTNTRASSSDTCDYNAHGQTAAGGNDNLKQLKDGFPALISTGMVDAIIHTGTTDAGVPIRWFCGKEVAL